MSSNRRHWLIGALGSAAAGVAGVGCAHRSALPRSGTGFLRLPVGQAHVVALSDGSVRRPLDAGFVRNAPLEQVKATLAQQGLPTEHLDVPYTCFVLELNDRRVLLDTGFADNGPAGTGQLHTHMRAAGIDPASIDTVVLSHCHGDHVNGLRRKDGALVYPRATVHVPAPEYAFWMDTARRDAAPEAARGGFNTVRRVLQDYPAAQLRQFSPGAELLPGVESIAAFGHSPGHTAIALRSGRERFTFLGDTAHVPALFVRHPDWQVMFDMDAAQARATRHSLLARMAQEGGLVGGYHFPLPSLGHIQRQGEGYRWQPARS